MTAADLDAVLAAWPLPGAALVGATARGTNNRSRYVETAAGPYVLRVYQNTASPETLRYEHALLRELQAAGLPRHL